MRDTVPSEELVTQTAFSPDATPLGPFPTTIGSPTTWLTVTSIRETVPSRPLATQTAFCVTARPVGPPPTGIVCWTSCVRGSTRDTLLPPVFDTQIASAPPAIPPGATPTGVWATTLPLLASSSPTAFAAIEASAADPPPCVRSTPATAPRIAAPNATPTRTRRRGRRQPFASFSAAASANSPARPSNGGDAAAVSSGKSSRSPVVTT